MCCQKYLLMLGLNASPLWSLQAELGCKFVNSFSVAVCEIHCSLYRVWQKVSPKVFTLFLAIAQNFELKFYMFITSL